jgi:hypothetical protein
MIPINTQKWQLICRDAKWIASNLPNHSRYKFDSSEDVIETALYIGLDTMKDEIVQHQTLEWIVREKTGKN